MEEYEIADDELFDMWESMEEQLASDESWARHILERNHPSEWD